MAESNFTDRTSQADAVAIPAKQYAEICQIMDDIDKERADREASQADKQARSRAIEHREQHPMAYLSDADIKAVGRRLWGILDSLRAIYDITGHVVDSELEAYGTAIREMARANIKGLDACLVRLTGGPCAGNFAEELEEA